MLSSLLLMLFGCGSRPGPYQKKDGIWYFKGNRVANGDPPDFAPLSRTFAKSSIAGYYRDSAIPDSDGPSFAVLSEHYAKDKRHVFYCDTFRKGQEYYMLSHNRTDIMEGADAATFQVLTDDHYARDATRVYLDGVAFPVKDVASFTLLDYGYAKDRFTGYYRRESIAGSDGPTFIRVDSDYAKDKDRVFYGTFVLKGAQPTDFVALDSGYAKSRGIVFYRGDPVQGVNASTFTVQRGLPGGGDAQDDKAIYAAGKKVRASK